LLRTSIDCAAVTVTARPFGKLPDGTAIAVYSIKSGAVEIEAIPYGAIITALRVRDRYGRLGDVVLGHASLDRYLQNPSYFGAIVGRYANRIAGGRFPLDGITYRLAANDGVNHLHGGSRGFDQRVWAAKPVRTGDAAGVVFARTSPAGEEHYPGTLRVAVGYLLATTGSIRLSYHATTDAPTIVNLTQHTYFNLAGETSTSVLDHEVTIFADEYTPVAETLIPTGELAPVAGTPFDFRTSARLGPRLLREDEQLRTAGGFDHNFVLRRSTGALAPAAELRDAETGRLLRVATTEPGLQFYGGHFLDGRTRGAYGRPLDRHAGLCLETQHFPDSPNQPRFPAVTLRPGERYRSVTTWEFSTE
jgi:aldose 1-epimerase